MGSTDDEKRDRSRAPIAVRVKLRIEDIDTFVERFAPQVSRVGIFLSSQSPKEVGTYLKFEIRLKNDSAAMIGTGTVRWVRPYDPRKPKGLHGMGIEFERLSGPTEAVLARILSYRHDQSMPETDGIPRAPNERAAPKRKRGGAPTASPARAKSPSAEQSPWAERVGIALAQLGPKQDLLQKLLYDDAAALEQVVGRARRLIADQAPDALLAELAGGRRSEANLAPPTRAGSAPIGAREPEQGQEWSAKDQATVSARGPMLVHSIEAARMIAAGRPEPTPAPEPVVETPPMFAEEAKTRVELVLDDDDEGDLGGFDEQTRQLTPELLFAAAGEAMPARAPTAQCYPGAPAGAHAEFEHLGDQGRTAVTPNMLDLDPPTAEIAAQPEPADSTVELADEDLELEVEVNRDAMETSIGFARGTDVQFLSEDAPTGVDDDSEPPSDGDGGSKKKGLLRRLFKS